MVIGITGCAGFIGSNLIRKLNKKIKIIGIDDFSGGYRKNLPNEKNFIFIRGDISKEKYLQKFFSYKPNIIIHFAAFSGFNNTSVLAPEKDLLVNTYATIKLLKFAVKFKIKKFINASSSCVYGNKNTFISENSNIDLETPYAISKFSSENYCRFFSKYNIKIINLRIFNTYGIYERPKRFSNVICKFFELAFQNKDLIVMGGKKSERCFLNIHDFTTAIEKILLLNNYKFINLNLGNDEPTKIYDLAKKINEITGNKKKIICTSLRDWDGILIRRPNLKKLKNLIDWKPTVNIEDGLYEYYNWYKKNYKKI